MYKKCFFLERYFYRFVYEMDEKIGVIRKKFFTLIRILPTMLILFTGPCYRSRLRCQRDGQLHIGS